jgi:hypothetical protein
VRFFAIAAVLLASFSTAAAAQSKPEPEGKYDVQKCTPRVVSHSQQRRPGIRIRKGEKYTGFSPIVAFEILESGEVANALLKRSSGIASMDNYALTWVQETNYSKRPGCGIVETQSDVTIEWR